MTQPISTTFQNPLKYFLDKDLAKKVRDLSMQTIAERALKPFKVLNLSKMILPATSFCTATYIIASNVNQCVSGSDEEQKKAFKILIAVGPVLLLCIRKLGKDLSEQVAKDYAAAEKRQVAEVSSS